MKSAARSTEQKHLSLVVFLSLSLFVAVREGTIA